MAEKIVDASDGQVFRSNKLIALPADTQVQITIETLPPNEQETESRRIKFRELVTS